MMEKTPRDLSLYSNHVLTILDTVLRSKDINMVEESLPTFEAYCKHADPASLAADQHRSKQYLSLVDLYASFADKNHQEKHRAGESVPMTMRWRTAGLRGIRAAVGSDALGADSAKQLSVVIPTILDNMSLERGYMLTSMQQRARTSEKQDMELARRRRMSSATISTVDTVESHHLTVSETTADADKAAEEEVRALALRCLKQIFSVGISSGRGVTRLATALVLRFIASKNLPKPSLQGSQAGNWATSLFEAIARWTPVQDRFIIVVTAMETLVRSPIVESVLGKQLVLATMIDWLLSSDINLIGLSVMDVLIGFINHTLLLLQLGGRDSKIVPHAQQGDTMGFYREAKETFDPSSVLLEAERGRLSNAPETTPSLIRQELLSRLQKCIASLSNHIYYTDQISDMMTAILARLKPSPNSEISTAAQAINNPSAATKTIAEAGLLQEDPSTDSFFSFATARYAALAAVKEILIRANNRRSASGANIEARSRVGVQVWDGTQWLLKDEDASVRLAYVDALLTWLRLETNKSDMLIPRDGPRKTKATKKTTAPNGEVSVAKRAVSGASRRDSKPARSAFLQLMHLAIYDSILDRASTELDALLLYLLLTKLVERLGVNALRTGLPMVLKLQETGLNDNGDYSAESKVHVASIVHGYLWTIAEKFEFEDHKVGHEINAEISRRKRFSIWFDKIKFPASSIDNIRSMVVPSEKTAIYSEDALGTLKPFLNVFELVEEVSEAYDAALLSPVVSPPSSPGRVFSVPTLGFGYGYGVTPGPKPSPQDQIPQRVKDEMAGAWSRESCIAAVEKESAGSMTGASSGPRHHLSVHSGRPDNSVDGRDQNNAGAEGAAVLGLTGGLGSLQKSRKASATGSPNEMTATSSRESTLRVNELKRALSGYNASGRQNSPLRRPLTRMDTQSSGSESLVSWNEADDRDVSTVNLAVGGANGNANTADKTSRPTTAKDGKDEEGLQRRPSADPRLGVDVPPVPKIPSSLKLPGTFPRDASPSRSPADTEWLERKKSRTTAAAGDDRDESPRSKRVTSSTFAGSSSTRGASNPKRTSRPPSSRAGFGHFGTGHDGSRVPSEKVDVGSLLAGIRPSASEASVAGSLKETGSLRLSKPPY